MTDKQRNHDEDLKTPDRSGHPPRPATEPEGAEGSSNPAGGATDPATGETKKPSRKT